MQLSLPTIKSTQPRSTSARKHVGPVIGLHDIDCNVSIDSRRDEEPRLKLDAGKASQSYQKLSVFYPQADSSSSTGYSSSASRTIKPSVSTRSIAANSAYMASEYAFSDVTSAMKYSPEIEVEEESPLTKHRRELKEDKKHEERLEEIRKQLKIGKYKDEMKRIDLFARKDNEFDDIKSVESVETLEAAKEDVQKESPYENEPKYINQPIKKA